MGPEGGQKRGKALEPHRPFRVVRKYSRLNKLFWFKELKKHGGRKMPKVKTDQGWIDIPFNSGLIAELMYRGFSVVPDEGADVEQEKLLINQSLSKLWGNNSLKTSPKTFNIPPPSILMPDTGKEFFSGNADRQGEPRRFNSQNVSPNPFLKYSIREVQPFSTIRDKLLVQNQPPSTETKDAGGLNDFYNNTAEILKNYNQELLA